eukprot:scaffold81982_cov31-Tisochrysis_lutea.AAC.4
MVSSCARVWPSVHVTLPRWLDGPLRASAAVSTSLAEPRWDDSLETDAVRSRRPVPFIHLIVVPARRARDRGACRFRVTLAVRRGWAMVFGRGKVLAVRANRIRRKGAKGSLHKEGDRQGHGETGRKGALGDL